MYMYVVYMYMHTVCARVDAYMYMYLYIFNCDTSCYYIGIKTCKVHVCTCTLVQVCMKITYISTCTSVHVHYK